MGYSPRNKSPSPLYSRPIYSPPPLLFYRLCLCLGSIGSEMRKRTNGCSSFLPLLTTTVEGGKELRTRSAASLSFPPLFSSANWCEMREGKQSTASVYRSTCNTRASCSNFEISVFSRKSKVLPSPPSFLFLGYANATTGDPLVCESEEGKGGKGKEEEANLIGLSADKFRPRSKKSSFETFEAKCG